MGRHDCWIASDIGVNVNCATAVMIDPATGNRFAGADPRRDCYAIAY
jgi:hypothetical protein